MSLFGFFTGTILQLNAKLNQMDKMESTGKFDFHLIRVREVHWSSMIGLVIVLLVTLTTMLTMIAVKDIFWLEHNPDRLSDGHRKISDQRIHLFSGGTRYAIIIGDTWSKLIKRILSQEHALSKVTNGEMRQACFTYFRLQRAWPNGINDQHHA